jgi:hypothetical protein
MRVEADCHEAGLDGAAEDRMNVIHVNGNERAGLPLADNEWIAEYLWRQRVAYVASTH